MPSVGNLVFTTWHGYLQDAFQRGAILPSPAGTDGAIVAASGWSPIPQHIKTMYDGFLDPVSMNTFINQCRGVGIAPTTVVDQFNLVWSVTILHVSPRPNGYNIATGLYQVVADWLMLPDTNALS